MAWYLLRSSREQFFVGRRVNDERSARDAGVLHALQRVMHLGIAAFDQRDAHVDGHVHRHAPNRERGRRVEPIGVPDMRLNLNSGV